MAGLYQSFIAQVGVVTAGGGGDDAATTAWVNAVVALGGTVSDPQKTRVNTLITSLKGHSLWTKLDRLWLYASEDPYQAKVDLIGGNIHTIVNTPSFTASQGYTEGATGGYFDTGAAPSALTAFQLNSASFGFYHRTALDGSGSVTQMGCRDGVVNVAEYINESGATGPYARVNCGFDGDLGALNTTNVGLVIVSRTAVDLTTLYRYYNANSGSWTTTTNSASRPTTNMYVIRGNNNGTPTTVSAAQFSIAFIGGGLNGTDASNMSADLNAYMTSLGTNVY